MKIVLAKKQAPFSGHFANGQKSLFPNRRGAFHPAKQEVFVDAAKGARIFVPFDRVRTKFKKLNLTLARRGEQKKYGMPNNYSAFRTPPLRKRLPG